ncbi:aldo/keto reductase [Streptomyces olivaceoviridis]|uniref:aldo/keto reductase n=1 Tax=Streptomyces olivaceoviridis TaxID=1921 RepID=UPI003686FF4F
MCVAPSTAACAAWAPTTSTYQLHRVDPDLPVEETWGVLAETVTAGKARHVGLSEVGVEQIKPGRPPGHHRAVRVLPVDPRRPGRVLPCGAAQGIRPAAVLAAGPRLPPRPLQLLRRTAGERPAAASAPVPAGQPAGQPRRRRRGPRSRRPRRLHPRADRLAWLVAQGEHVVPVPGAKTPTYPAENAGGADVRLSAADLADLDAIPAPVGARY